MNWRDIPVPARIAKLDRDTRGLPIPFLVQRDAKTGRPYFTINDARKHARCLAHDLCALCGEQLLRGRWSIGGPLSAFHARGWYIDTPLHEECAHFALRVCPYLAAPVYAKRIDDGLFDFEANPGVIGFRDPSVDNERPPVFVAVMSVGTITKRREVDTVNRPQRPYRKIEFWRQGQQISDDEGWLLANATLHAAHVREGVPLRKWSAADFLGRDSRRKQPPD